MLLAHYKLRRTRIETSEEFLDGAKDLLSRIKSLPVRFEGAEELETALRRVISVGEIPVLPAKLPPPTFGPVNADDLYDLTSRVCNKPPYKWDHATLAEVIFRMRQVSTFLMRGSSEAIGALEKFLAMWQPFVMSRPDLVKLLDPELIIMDVMWGPPAGWGATQVRANAHTAPANQVIPATIPPNPAGVPGGAPGLPNVGGDGNGNSDYFFVTGGTALAAGSFGTALHFQHYGAVRGHWRVNAPVAPVYY